MRKRELRFVSLSVLVVLLIVAPAFALDAYKPYTDFGKVYQFNPWSSESGDWTKANDSGTEWSNSPAGFLSYNSDHTAKYAGYSQVLASPATTTWTFEVRAQVDDQGAQTGSATQMPAGLWVGIMNNASQGKQLTELVIQKNNIQLRTSTGWVPLDNTSNSDGYHKTRLARDASGVRVYRDDSETPLNNTVYTVASGSSLYGSFTSFAGFGDNAYAAGSTDGLHTSIDYLAYDLSHAYAPEPTTMILLAAGSLACLLRKRH